jgi:hypothetical protein
VVVLGGNASTMAVANSFRPSDDTANATITAHLVPLAWTPLGIVVGIGRQAVGISLAGLLEWIDRTFPPEDEHAFVAPLRDLELLARIGWEAPLPEHIDEASVLNLDDLPDEVVDALAHAPAPLVQCAACRRLCVRDEFVWKEKQLCAWDYHAQVFGKRGPWHEGAYEERHFATLPACAYVAPSLLKELGVEIALTVNVPEEPILHAVVTTLLAHASQRPHMAVRTNDAVTVLREA